MQLHQLRPKNKPKKKKRVGRGGKRGTYSGRGMKGQRSRSGARVQPIIRELIKRYPKLRGYRFKSIKTKPVGINIGTLEEKFKSGDRVNFKSLLNRGIIHKTKGKFPNVKILGKGKISKKLNIENFDISKSAKEKIEKAGGTIKQNSK